MQPAWRVLVLMSAALSASVVAEAQRVSTAEPVLQSLAVGYVPLSGARAPLVLHGRPGAAHVGEPVAGGQNNQFWWISSTQEYALVARDGELGLQLLNDGAVQAAFSVLVGAMATPNLVTFSPDGGTAALYDAHAGVLQLMTGLPSTGVVASRSNLPPGTHFVRLAVSDGGLVAGQTGDDTLLIVNRQETQVVPALGGIAAISFLAGTGSSLLVASRGPGQVVQLDGLSGTARRTVLAGSAQGVTDPVALLAVDSARALVVNRGDAKVLLVGVDTPLVRTLACDGQPTGVQRSRQKAVWVLTGDTPESNWLLSLDDGGTSASFVPVLNVER